jgi:hypothetical protein
MPKTTLDKCDICNVEVITMSRHKKSKKHLKLYNHLTKKKEIALTNEKIEDFNIKNEIKELLSQLTELINKI